MQYYRPTMPSQVSGNQNDDNEVEGTNDDIPPPPPPTLHPNNSHNNDHEDNEEDNHVAQLHIDENFSYISIL